MNMQRATFALSLATLCLVLVLLAIVLRQQKNLSSLSISDEETGEARVLIPPAGASRTATGSQRPSSIVRATEPPPVIIVEPEENTPTSRPTLGKTQPLVPPPVSVPLSGASTVNTAQLVAQIPQNGATITGKIQWLGAKPRTHQIYFDVDPRCAAMHHSPVFADNIVVNDNATLRNVFVFVNGGLEGLKFEAPTTPVRLDQRGCLYQPHVLGMMARQPLLIVNDDDTLHNIHALPHNSREFNVGQPNQGQMTTRTFAEPEVMVHVKCDVHPWMSMYIGVLDHPFFTVTGDDGSFRIDGLPPGTFVIETWHEAFGIQTQSVTVAYQETKEVNFTYSKDSNSN